MKFSRTTVIKTVMKKETGFVKMTFLTDKIAIVLYHLLSKSGGFRNCLYVMLDKSRNESSEKWTKAFSLF